MDAGAVLPEALPRAALKDLLGTVQWGGDFIVTVALPLVACTFCRPVAMKTSSSLWGGGGGGLCAGTWAALRGGGVNGVDLSGGAVKGGALIGGGAATVLAAIPM